MAKMEAPIAPDESSPSIPADPANEWDLWRDFQGVPAAEYDQEQRDMRIIASPDLGIFYDYVTNQVEDVLRGRGSVVLQHGGRLRIVPITELTMAGHQGDPSLVFALCSAIELMGHATDAKELDDLSYDPVPPKRTTSVRIKCREIVKPPPLPYRLDD